MAALVLDIETAADDEAVTEILAEGPPTFEPHAGWGPEAQARDIAKREAAWAADVRKKAGLDHFAGRVVCVGHTLVEPHMSMGEALGSAIFEADEGEMLRYAIEVCEQAVCGAITTILVTWNGIGFDAPFLRSRLLRHGLPVHPLLMNPRRYTYRPHCDVRMLLADWDSHARGTLGRWAAHLRLPRRPEPDHAEKIQGWMDAGDHASISRACCLDVEATADLYLACLPLLGQPARRAPEPPTADDLAAYLAADKE